MPASALRRIAAVLLAGWLLLPVSGGVPAFAQTAGARLPPMDVFVYLDNSKTLFTGTDDAPAQRVVTMLKALFREPIDGGRPSFVARGDRVSLYTFGRNVVPFAQTLDGGDTAALDAALDRFTTTAKADRTTEIDKLLDAIARNPSIKEDRANRLKVVLIASDFLHDPSDAATTKTRNGICDLLDDFKKGKGSPVDAEARAAQAIVNDPASPLPVSVALLEVRPKESDFKSATYRECAMETVRLRPVIQTLQRDLDATVIEYEQVKEDTAAFTRGIVTAVMKATLPRLTVERAVCRPRGTDRAACTLTVRNPGGTENEIRAVTLRAAAGGSVIATRPLTPVQAVKPGRAEEITVDFIGDEGRAINAAPAPVLTLEDNGRGRVQPFPVTHDKAEALAIRHAEAYRERAADPYTLTLELANTQQRSKTVEEVALNTGGAEQPVSLSGTFTVPAGGTEKISLPLPVAADAVLADGVQVTVTSRDVDGNIARSAPVAVKAFQGQPLTILKAEARADAANRISMTLSLENSDQRYAKTVTRVDYYAAQESVVPLPEGAPIQDQRPIAPGGSETLSLLLPDAAAQQILKGELFVSVTDSQTGKPSKRGRVTPPRPDRNELAPDACKVEEATNQSIDVQCRVVNRHSILSNTVTALRVSGKPEDAFTRTAPSYHIDIPVTGKPVVAAGATMENISAALSQFDTAPADAYRRLRDFKMIRIQTVDGAGLPSDTEFKFTWRRSPPTIDPSESRFTKQSDQVFLKLQVVSHDSFERIIKNIYYYQSSKTPKDKKEIPLYSNPLHIKPNIRNEPYLIPINKSTQESGLDPYKPTKIMLVTDRDPPEETGEGTEVNKLAAQPLRIGQSPPNWEDGSVLVLGIENAAGHVLTLEGIKVKTEGQNFSSLIRPTNFDGRVEGKEETFRFRFAEDFQSKYLLGNELSICPVTAEIEVDCNIISTKIFLTQRTELEVRKRANQPSAIGSNRTISVDLFNPGKLPNQAAELVLWKNDGTYLDRVTIGEPVVVPSGEIRTQTIELPEDKYSAAYRAQAPQISVRDLANKSQPLSQVDDNSKYELRMERYDYRLSNSIAQSIPGADAHILVRTDVTFARSMSTLPQKERFRVTFIDGKGMKRSVTPVDVDFTGKDAAGTLWWRFPVNSDDFKSARLNIVRLVGDKEDSQKELKLELSETTHLGYYLASAAFALPIGGFLGLFIISRQTGVGFWPRRDQIRQLELAARWMGWLMKIPGLGLGSLVIMFTVTVMAKILEYFTWWPLFVGMLVAAIIIFAVSMLLLNTMVVQYFIRYLETPIECPRINRSVFWLLAIVFVIGGLGAAVFLWNFPEIYTPSKAASINCYADLSKPSTGTGSLPQEKTCNVGGQS